MRWCRVLSLGLASIALAACGGGDAEDPPGIEPVAAGFAPADAPETSDGVIAAAAAAGEIDAETALAYRVFALFGDPRLPERFRRDEPEPNGNEVIDDLRQGWDGLSQATRALLAPFRLRPLAAGAWLAATDPGPAQVGARAQPLALARPSCTTSATWGSVAATVAGVRVWYDKSRPADLTQAQATVAALDAKVWPTLITSLGFKAPLSDLALSCDGGDGRLDIYIVASLGARGVTYPESASAYQSSSFILLRSGLGGATLQHTLTHQFMHAVQWSYLMLATQTSYGWMRNALANWAVEAVYPGNAVLLADASCHMNSNFLTLSSRTAGACSTSTTRTRDHGAYLLYQYIGRTLGKLKVRELLAATTTTPSALGAIEAGVPGGLRALWPKYAKTLWNQAPVTDPGRPAFFNWDGQTSVAVLAPDHPTPVNANVGSLAEATTSLSASVANVSTRFYRFTVSEAATRSLMFHNTFYPLTKAGRKVSVQALWRTAAGPWVEEDWSLKEWIGLCRDAKAQRMVDLVLIIASAEVGSVTRAVAAAPPTFKRNKIGCWGFAGTARRSVTLGSWSSGTSVLTVRPRFDWKPNGLMSSLQYNDPATGRLRVPIASPMLRNLSWTLVEQYTENGCSYSLNKSGTSASINLGGTSAATLVINNFTESLPAALRLQQHALVGTTRGAYTANGSTAIDAVTGTISGPQPRCGTSYTVPVGLWLLSNDVPGQGQVIGLDGRLKGTFSAATSPDSTVYSWDLAPLSEP